MMWLIAASAVVLGLALVAVIWRRASASYVPGPRREAWSSTDATGRVLRVDIAAADPQDAAVQRLARDVAWRTLQADPDLDHVEVRDRDDVVLLVEQRHPKTREVTLPEALSEPHAPPRRTPSPVRPSGEVTHRRRVPEPAPTVPVVPLADRLDLPGAVRARVRDPDRAVDVVRAILEVAGRTVTVDGDLLRCEDVAIVVVDPRPDAERALTHGYLRIQETDAARGLVLRTGYADPRLVRRREASAPHVRHLGPDALQRMADAVALGADPFTFAAGPSVTAVPSTG